MSAACRPSHLSPLALEHEGEPEVAPRRLHAPLALDLTELGQWHAVIGKVQLLHVLVLDQLQP